MRTTGSGVQWLLAVLAAAVATGVCVLLDRSMSVAGLAMAYLVGVVACALTLGRGPGILCSLLSVSALNYFFVPPRYSFEVDGAEYWWTLAVLLGLSLALNALIASLRERRSRAELGEARAARLHALGEALADCKGHEAMARVAAQWLHQALGRPCAVFLLADDGGGEPRCWGEPGSEAAFHSRSALWAIEQGRMLGRGCDDWPDLPLWCAPLARHGSAGALQVLLAPGDRPAPDELQHWQALTRQVGLSVERERAAARAQEAQDSARAEAARNTLLASLSHDLRTPLAGIVGSASALRTLGDAMPARERGQLLENLENEARDLTLMADNILQMARLSQPHDSSIAQFVAASLSAAGFLPRAAATAGAAEAELRLAPCELLIVDLGLPDEDGVALIARLRQRLAVPILVLSARLQESQKIAALDAGADDYLTKPFGVGELLARVRAMLRRAAAAPPPPSVFRVGQLELDREAHRLQLRGEAVHLTPLEFRLLERLARAPGKVVTHRQLLADVWGTDQVDQLHYLRIYMGHLRAKLEDDPAEPRYLLTELGVGYRLADE